jgi:uncharacterized protein YaaQ
VCYNQQPGTGALNAERLEAERLMKLIVAIVQDYDCDRLLRAIVDAGLLATRIASTGGFLRAGNTTVILGVQDDQVRQCVQLIRTNCRSRVERTTDSIAGDFTEWNPAGIAEVTIGGGVVFVANVSRFDRIHENGT